MPWPRAINESIESIAETVEGTNQTAILLDRTLSLYDVPDRNAFDFGGVWLMPYGRWFANAWQGSITR